MSRVLCGEEIQTSEDLFGQVNYYEALFRRGGLIKREGEFRNYKLGLILDILKTLDMPEDLKASLESAILESWRLEIPEKTMEQREDELEAILYSIQAVKNAIKWVKRHPYVAKRRHLNVSVLFALPMMHSDLLPANASRIFELLSQAIDCFAVTKECKSN
ncbi:MAG: hypothetical protein WB392_12210 [Methanotrichaceae archaeon]